MNGRDVESLYLAGVLAGLFAVAMLYSSVGHGGASGYLAVLSLTAYAGMESDWLRQHAWSLNLVVAGIAFWHYRRAGHHVAGLTLPFIAASIPLAMLGGTFRVEGVMYDTLLSLTLVLAAWRLLSSVGGEMVTEQTLVPELRTSLPIGGGIGLVSGVVGIGGGIFLSPIVMLKGWASPKTTAATAALFVWANSAAGLVGAGISGRLLLDLDTLALFAVAVVIGGMVGARYGAVRAPPMIIRRLLVGVLLIAAARRVLDMMGIWL